MSFGFDVPRDVTVPYQLWAKRIPGKRTTKEERRIFKKFREANG